MSIRILFRIDSTGWEATRQASMQYDQSDDWSSYPDWQLIPFGTLAFMSDDFADRAQADLADIAVNQDPSGSRLLRAQGESSPGGLAQGFISHPLDFAVWLARLLEGLTVDFRGEERYFPQDHEYGIAFDFDGTVVRITSTLSPAEVLLTSQSSFRHDIEHCLRGLVGVILERAPNLLM